MSSSNMTDRMEILKNEIKGLSEVLKKYIIKDHPLNKGLKSLNDQEVLLTDLSVKIIEETEQD